MTVVINLLRIHDVSCHDYESLMSVHTPSSKVLPNFFLVIKYVYKLFKS